MRTVPTPVSCERVRGQISLQLDAELSELERRMVARHLERCLDCRAFEESTAAFTAELRAAPLEPLRRPVVVHRVRRPSFAATQAAVAAVVAIAAIGVVGQLGLTKPRVASQGGQSVARSDLFATSWRPEWETAQLEAAARDPGEGRPGPLPAV